MRDAHACIHCIMIHSPSSPLNLTSQSFLDYLKNLTSDIAIVQGDFDEFNSPEHAVGGLPGTIITSTVTPLLCTLAESTMRNMPQVVKIGDFRIGVCHGHQVWAEDSVNINVRGTLI